MVSREAQRASWQRQVHGPMILYTGRVSQVLSGEFQRYLATNGLVCWMNTVGHFWMSVECEDFFGLLKRAKFYRTKHATHQSSQSQCIRMHQAALQPMDAAKNRQADFEAPFHTLP